MFRLPFAFFVSSGLASLTYVVFSGTPLQQVLPLSVLAIYMHACRHEIMPYSAPPSYLTLQTSLTSAVTTPCRSAAPSRVRSRAQAATEGSRTSFRHSVSARPEAPGQGLAIFQR
ncbi:hypothetical protein B0H19DRAFT_1160622 [Mycena capillaripes]|nr:hypothetical protein B0H19DRAFT_1160622 [Mycena capillaripes]